MPAPSEPTTVFSTRVLGIATLLRCQGIPPTEVVAIPGVGCAEFQYQRTERLADALACWARGELVVADGELKRSRAILRGLAIAATEAARQSEGGVE